MRASAMPKPNTIWCIDFRISTITNCTNLAPPPPSPPWPWLLVAKDLNIRFLLFIHLFVALSFCDRFRTCSATIHPAEI